MPASQSIVMALSRSSMECFISSTRDLFTYSTSCKAVTSLLELFTQPRSDRCKQSINSHQHETWSTSSKRPEFPFYFLPSFSAQLFVPTRRLTISGQRQHPGGRVLDLALNFCDPSLLSRFPCDARCPSLNESCWRCASQINAALDGKPHNERRQSSIQLNNRTKITTIAAVMA